MGDEARVYKKLVRLHAKNMSKKRLSFVSIASVSRSNFRARKTFFTCVFALVEALVDNADVQICLDLVLASDIVGEVHNFLVAE